MTLRSTVPFRRPLVRAAMPDGITGTQSYTWVLREIFLNTVVALPFFAGFNIRRNKRKPIQLVDLPLLGVYILDEQMGPDGDANHGEIRFIHTFRIGFSVMIVNNDDDVAEQKLDAAFWAIMNGLWRDQYVTSLWDTVNPHTGVSANPDSTRFESVVRGTRKHVWGSLGSNQETAFAELEYVPSIVYRADYPAIVTDELDLLHVVTAYPPGSDPSQVQQITWIYDFTSQRAKRSLANGANQSTNNADGFQAAEPSGEGQASPPGGDPPK